MSLNKDYDLMKTSFLEAKDIINKIFEYLDAPDYYFVKHMTFDELVAALYRLLSIYEDIYNDDSPHIEYIVDTFDGTITSDDILLNKIAYSKGQQIEGNIVSFPSHTYMPTTIDIVIPEKHYLKEDQIIKGDRNLIPENIRKDVTIFNVAGELEEVTKYNIIYVTNISKQYVYQQQVEYGEQFSIINTQPVLDNYRFKGWSPDPNSETVIYRPGQLVTTNLANKGGACILYAVFEKEE